MYFLLFETRKGLGRLSLLVRRLGVLSLMLLLLVLSGCYRGSNLPPTPFADLPPPPDLTPQPVAFDGSALMQPLLMELVHDFRQAYIDLPVSVGASGTRTGFERFCGGQTMLQNALRPMIGREQETCAANDVDWRAMTIAIDAVAVVTPVGSAINGCLNLIQLSNIWRADSILENWQQINLNYPDAPLIVYGAPPDSLAYTLFQQTVLAGGGFRQPLSQGPPVGDSAVGFLSLGQALQLAPNLQALPLAVGGGAEAACISPTEASAADGRYPLSRPLFLYVNTDALLQPSTGRLLQFMLGPEADPAIRRVYLVPPSDEDRLQSLEALNLVQQPDG